MDRSHVGPHEDSFRSANEDESSQEFQNKFISMKKIPVKALLILTQLHKWISYTLEQKKINSPGGILDPCLGIGECLKS